MKTDQKRVKKMNWRMVLILVVLVCTIWAGSETAVYATAVTNADWARPQRIPGYAPESGSPVLIADQNQTVHTFGSQPLGNQSVIVYSQWAPERGWTIPVDILLPLANNQARLNSVVLDDEGVFHLVFFSGNDVRANIYYSQAPAVHAGRATAWTQPVNIGPVTIAPTVARLVQLQGGELVFVYSSRLHGQGLYAAYSFDKGETWTAPEPFFLTYDNDLWPTPLELYEDSNGRLHALWGLVDRTGNSLAIYYAWLDGADKQWTTPTVFAEAIDFEADTPAIVEHDDQLIVVYHNNFPTTRWMRRSFDGGDTWTDPVRLFAHVGSNGPAAFVHDSDNVLHMFFGNRVGNPIIQGMWHTTWQSADQRWREPEPVVSGPRIVGRVGGNGFDPDSAQAVVLQGNRLLITWLTDPGAGRNGVWYTYTHLDTPMLPLQPLPEPTLTPTPTHLPSIEPSLLEESDIESDPGMIQDQNASEPGQSSHARILLVSTLTAGLFVIFVLGVFGFRIRSRD